MADQKINVFFSYSHKDEKLRDSLEKHLSLLKRDGVISEWHDRRIGPGGDWHNEIAEQLSKAQIILLLISSDFLASDYAYDVEVKRALELHKAGHARVIPVILRPCEWQQAPFATFRALPLDGRPVTQWRPQDNAFRDVARGIRDAINGLRLARLESKVEEKPKVIVADDERVLADTLAMIFNQSGFQARAVYSGEKCLELAKEYRPFFIISDVIMGDMNGIDAAIRIRAIFPDCGILLFSGQAATADLMEKARAEGYEFQILAKPVHPQDLLARVRAQA
jgi:CheY-like chemotaxis protein